MERFLQYFDEVDDFVYSMPLLWETLRRWLAHLVALLSGALAGLTIAFAVISLPVLAAGVLLAATLALICWLLRQPLSRLSTRHS